MWHSEALFGSQVMCKQNVAFGEDVIACTPCIQIICICVFSSIVGLLELIVTRLYSFCAMSDGKLG